MKSAKAIIITTTKSSNRFLKCSNLVEKIGELEIYQYPKIEFTYEEIQKTIIIMVIGLTECGKTTLLNSYINYLMDIYYGNKILKINKNNVFFSYIQLLL